jgi:hypothetical protein
MTSSSTLADTATRRFKPSRAAAATPPVQPAVADFRPERVEAPVARHRHHVHMPVEQQGHVRVRRTDQAQHRAIAVYRDRAEARLAHGRGHQRRHLAFLAGKTGDAHHHLRQRHYVQTHHHSSQRRRAAGARR